MPGGGVVISRSYLIPDLAVVDSAQAVDRDHKGDPARVHLVVEVQSASSALDVALPFPVHVDVAALVSS